LDNQAIIQTNQATRTELGRPRRTRFWVLVGAGALVAVLVLALIVESAISFNKVHTGVSVAGVELGGLTPDEAAGALAEHVAAAQAHPLELTGGGKSWEIMPAEAGTSMATTAAVAAAMDLTRESNLFADIARRWKLYFSDMDLPLEGTVDIAKVDSLVAGIARELDIAPVDARLIVDQAGPRISEGWDGRAVDRAALAEQLTARLLALESTGIAIPLVVQEQEITPEDLMPSLEQAQIMTSAPITLTNGEDSWTLSPEDLLSYMTLAPQTGGGVSTLAPVISTAKMEPFFAEIAGSVAKDPVDASFASDGYKAWVVPAQPGEKLDPRGTTEAVMAAALDPAERTAEVAVIESEPGFTTAAAEAMGIKDRLATYETEPYSGSSNRQVNVRITTKYAENVLLAPGEEYDFDERIGPRTPERGYKLAPGIVGNGVMKNVYGGGICQVSTTLFNAVLEAGLEILERHNHSLYINHYPDGRDATVAGQSKNFRFRNDTDHYIWIRGKSDGVRTKFTIYGTDDGREAEIKFSGFSHGAGRTEERVVNPALAPGETHVVRSGQSGRSCSITRPVTMPDGTILHNGPEVYKSYYPMISKLIQVGPAATTTTGPATTPTTKKPSGTTGATTF
jgi:vancomycin resistance protein YoaR